MTKLWGYDSHAVCASAIAHHPDCESKRENMATVHIVERLDWEFSCKATGRERRGIGDRLVRWRWDGPGALMSSEVFSDKEEKTDNLIALLCLLHNLLSRGHCMAEDRLEVRAWYTSIGYFKNAKTVVEMIEHITREILNVDPDSNEPDYDYYD